MNSRTRALGIGLTLCLVRLVTATDQPAHEEASVTVVEVPVYVTDLDGGPVPDLRIDEFAVKDNGVKQTLLFAARVGKKTVAADAASLDEAGGAGPTGGISMARNFVFLFDLTFTDPAALSDSRKAALDFVSSTLSQDDYAAVFTLDTGAGVKLLMNFTRDRRQLQNAITTFGASKGAAFVPDSAGLVRMTTAEQSRQQGLPPPTVDLGGGLEVAESTVGSGVRRDLRRSETLQMRGSIGAYLTGLSSFAKGIDILAGRKIVLFFSRGFDTKALAGQTTQEASAQAESFTRGEWENLDPTVREVDTRNIEMLDQVVSSFASSDCRVFCIDASGGRVRYDAEAEPGGTTSRTHAALEMLSKETGGKLFASTGDVATAMKQIDEATSSYYLLAYHAPPETRGKYHKIDVDVARPRVKISHRKGYYGERSFEQYSELDKQIQIGAILARGFADSRTEVPSAAVPLPVCVRKGGTPATPDATRCAVIVEIPASGLARLGSPETKELEVYSFATLPGTGEIRGYLHGTARIKDPGKASGLRYTDVMDLLPGSYEIVSIVRSLKTGAAVTSRTQATVEASPGFALAATFVSEKSAWENTTSNDVAGECHPFAFKGTVLPAQGQLTVTAGGSGSLMVKAFNLQLDSAGKPDFDLAWSVITPTGMAVSLSSYSFLRGDWPSKSEYDLMFSLTFPAQLVPGSYRLAVRATDKLGRASRTVMLPVTIAAAP